MTENYWQPPMPFIEPTPNVTTFANQRRYAKKLLAQKGLKAVMNPHGRIGQECGCKGCFCCAALSVYNEFLKSESRFQYRKA